MDTIQQSGSSPQDGRAEADTRTPDVRIVDEATTAVVAMAGQALDQMKFSGTSLAAAAADAAKDVVGQQIASGGELIGHVADSTKSAADELEQHAPVLAGIVRQASDSIAALSSELKTRSVDELVQSTSDLARRRPELVFGVSAVLGFLAFRVLTSSAAAGPRGR